MSVRAGAFSSYGNLTVSGVILASAHGSGLGTINSLGSLVTKVKWVNGKGEILVSDSATEAGAEEVKALVGGLGLLGIATEFTLQLEPSSRTVVETRNNLDDTQIVADVSKMLEEETPHVIVYWRPDFGTYRAIMWTPVLDGSVYNPAGGSSEEPAFRSNARSMYLDPVEDQIAGGLNKLMAAWEEDTAEESPIADVLNSGTHRHHASDEFNSFIRFFLHSHTQSKGNLCNQSIVLTTSRRSQDLMQGYSENMTTMNC
jgi:FAD/FMN-containing dehydrogenase